MLLEILAYPHPLLAAKCEPVGEITPEIRQLAADMLETMYNSRGVGLAAPQIGRSLRMLVMDAGQAEEDPDPRVIINPELQLLGEMITSEKEGCLSVPLGYRADVRRHESVHLKGLDLDGNELDEELSGFPAIVLQHETDHLDGKLFIDRLSHLRRSLYDARVKKWRKRKKEE